ncbi:hypothetical protein [Bradyrhizobium sp. HKCCYLS20291]
MFNLTIDGKLRGCDAVAIKVADVTAVAIDRPVSRAGSEPAVAD